MMGCYPLVGYIVKGVERFYELFCLFYAQFFFFLVTIRKQLTLERATVSQLVATWQLGCQTRPPFSNVPNVLSSLTTSLCFVYFFSLLTARKSESIEILLSKKKRDVRWTFLSFFRQKLKDGSINDDSDRQSYFILFLSVNVWRRKIRGARRRVVKWRPRGCLGVRLERVNRKLKPFKCKGEETVIYVSFIVCYDLNKPFLSITLEKTTRVFYELQQRAVCNSLYFYNSLYCSNFVK